MRKTLSVFLAVLMLITIVMPISVYAKNGPYKSNNADDSTMALISFVDVYGDISFLYPASLDTQLRFKNSKNISYDEKTNTLTLSNFKTDEIMVVTAMGDDFKIKLSGYNELGCIISSDLSWGSSITITGSGVLYVNEKKNYADAVFVDGSGTGKAFFKVEKTVGVKLFKGDNNAVGVYGVSEADAKKVIVLEGTVSAGETKSYKYVRNIYEQEKVKSVIRYEGTGVFCGKTGTGNENKIFIAEISDENKNTFNVAEVVFDNELKKYIVLPVTDNNKNITLKEKGYISLAEEKYPDDVLVIDDYVVNMDVCIDENGKKCVFTDCSELSKPESDIEVYEILEHKKYGKLALIYNPKKTYKELRKIKSVTEYDHTNNSGTIMVNSVPETIPAKVILKSVTNINGGVNVTWNAVNNADCYRVFRSQMVNGKWSKWSQIGKVKTTSYSDKKTVSGNIYRYTVRAENILGLGGCDANGLNIVYLALPTTTISNTADGVKVSWKKIPGAIKYAVYRSQYENGKWTVWKPMYSTDALKGDLVDKKVSKGVLYRYTVIAVNNKVRSSYSSSNGVMYLAAPTVKITNNSTGVKVAWSKVPGANNYIVYRSAYIGGEWLSWKTVTKTGAVTSCIDDSVISGVTYKYTVRAVTGKSASVYRDSNSLSYLSQPVTTISNASNGINVEWTKSDGAANYTVYRSEYNPVTKKWSGWTLKYKSEKDIYSWTDKTVKDGVGYKYIVRASNKTTNSSYVATSGLVRLSVPNVKAVVKGTNVNVSWNEITGATSYVVYRSEFVDGKWGEWQIISGVKTTYYIDENISEGATYRYTVRAKIGSSLSGYIVGGSVKR